MIGVDKRVAPASGLVHTKRGAVLSRFTVTCALAVPPRPVAVPATTWPIASVETMTGAGQYAAFVQVKVTVTVELFQPAAFAAGLEVAEIVGLNGATTENAAFRLAVCTPVRICTVRGP